MLLASKKDQFSIETQTSADCLPPPPPPPKLGFMTHQLSTETETQTDTSTQIDDEAWKHMETQFDLDDILCSNYTQTIFDNDEVDDELIRSCETQTQMKQVSHSETQTLKEF